MKRVYLSLNDVDLGYLIDSESQFEFVADEQAILKVEKENPFIMKMYKLNKNGTKAYEQIPEPFSRFLPSNSRMDLMEKANISLYDDQFEKLYKLAGLNVMQINFKIHQ